MTAALARGAYARHVADCLCHEAIYSDQTEQLASLAKHGVCCDCHAAEQRAHEALVERKYSSHAAERIVLHARTMAAPARMAFLADCEGDRAEQADAADDDWTIEARRNHHADLGLQAGAL